VIEDPTELLWLRQRCLSQQREIEQLRTELARCQMVISAGIAGRQVTISDQPPPRALPPRRLS
jgi:hypothetical protein